jgi:glycosyltransferase involved in cell wall biosynthesis
MLVVVRIKDVEKVPPDWNKASGPGVEFCAIPDYNGPWQYLRARRKVADVLEEAIARCDAYILRVPCVIATLAWKNLPKGAPYGVEVVSIPWDGFAPGAVKGFARPVWRRLFHHYLKEQCQQAAAAAYVSGHAIQRLYPPGQAAFTTNYSSVDLDSSYICTNPHERLARIKTIPARLRGDGQPVHLGYIGSSALGNKRPDLHIKAVAHCIAQGANLILEMIGDGPLLADMRTLARQLGIGDRVVFRGRIPGGKPIFDALDTFDLFLNATATEGLPRVVIEAMARGCPCIATDVGGIPELVRPDFLVPLFDPGALARRIIEVLKDPQRMSDAALYSINHARDYCNDVLQPRRQAFYQAVCDRTQDYQRSRLQNV